MPGMLRLEAREFADPARWRWTLTDADTGAFLADHEVRLDPASEQYEALTGLRQHVSWHAAPDARYPEDEKRIVAETGDWIGDQVFGNAIMQALAGRRPATVRVILPPEAGTLAYLPLEIARAGGKTLAERDIALIIETGTGGPPAPPKNRVTDRLRVLGLFSLPNGGTPLSLRRERHELVNLIRGIAASGRAADVRVLEYGVTRASLRDVLEEAEGWDVLHVSGHGAPGELIFETPAGAPDRITAADLADLLEVARERVKLVTLAACWSAAPAVADQRRLLHLPIPEQDQRPSSPERIVATAPPPGALATELASRLGCAVLAMRYPVDDEFAITLSGKLYDLLARQAQPLPRAVTLTLQHLADGTGGREFPALSMAAPALFGPAAADLRLPAPKRSVAPSFRPENLKLAGFPPQPDRFVGRTGVMMRASAALAVGSGVPGVLLHGMPGGGKTACALELAYTHEDAFQGLIWYKAPDEGAAIDGALTDFALTLERSIDGLPMIDKLADESKLDAFLPVLTELMERTRLLIVIDNAESLLTDTGQWRDDRWAKVFGALTAHTGFGRVVATSRRAPAASPSNATDCANERVIARPIAQSRVLMKGAAKAEGTAGRLLVEAVDALSLDEALLLARELPSLRKLIYGELPGIDRGTARKLARGVLNVAQGHPKLLELADGQAGHPEQLAALVESGDRAWQDQRGLPDGFFATGETTADPGDYLQVLAAWTESVTATLSPGARDLFCFLCCLEEPDRIRPVLDGNWADLWQRLGRDGQPPGLDQALPELAAHGLATIRADGGSGESDEVRVHPGVTAAGRDQAGQDFQTAVDTEAGAFWYAVYEHALGENDDGSVNTELVVRAGLAAVPYLLRQEHWDRAAVLLENAFVRDPSRVNAAAMLPAITRIADHNSRHAGRLARILQALDPAAAETRLSAFLDTTAACGDYQAASVTAGHLVDLYLDSGQLTEAIDLTDRQADYTRQAGLGPWAQLADQVQRLQVLNSMGHAIQVLDEVQRLRRHVGTLPDRPDPDDTVSPWDVREGLLGAGRAAAIDLGRWQEALDLNAEIAASEYARRAPASDTARTRFNDFGPLLRLGRTGQALDLLLDCRQVFHDTGDIRGLGKTLGALADIENERGHGDSALRLQRDALRYSYLAADVGGIARCYYDLGDYFHVHAGHPVAALAAHLAAALIRTLTGIGGTGDEGAASSVRHAAIDLRASGTAGPPADIAALCHRLADIEGTDLPTLIRRLEPDPETAEQTLRDLIAQARQLAEPPPGDTDPS
ncbi:MAG: CHAT domain-containing protein [Nocardiopsaceae bacterium]|nr:CHAT domain-containing protein [Nocardiopsaceae bacterium]